MNLEWFEFGGIKDRIPHLANGLRLFEAELLRFFWDGHRNESGSRRRRLTRWRCGGAAVGIVLPDVDDAIVTSGRDEVRTGSQVTLVLHRRRVNEEKRVHGSRVA